MAMPGGIMSPWGLARRRRLDAEQPGRRIRRRYVRARGAPRAAAIARPYHFPYHFGDQPQRKFCRLKYCHHITSASIGAGACVVYEFRANGMFDPYAPVGGHQPYGYDQLMAAYTHYTVLSASFRVEINDVVSQSNQTWLAMLYNATGVAAAAYAAGGENALNELPVVSRSLMPAATGVKGQVRAQTLYANFPRIFGKPASSMIGDSLYQGDVAADPTQQAYFAVVGYVQGGSASETDGNIKVDIVYNCVFTEPKYFTSS